MYESLVGTELFQMSAIYDSDGVAQSVVASDVASSIASCVSDAVDAGGAHAPGAPDSLLPSDASVTAVPNAFLPGAYGEQSQISSVTIESSTGYGGFDIAVVRVGPMVSTIVIIDPVIDQTHDLLSIVTQKMGGSIPPTPDMGME